MHHITYTRQTGSLRLWALSDGQYGSEENYDSIKQKKAGENKLAKTKEIKSFIY